MTPEENYEGILLEEIRENVKILAEGQIAIRDNLDIVKSDVSTLKSDVSTLKSDVSTLKSDVSTLKSDVSTLKSDVSTLKSDLATFKEDTKQNFKTVMEYLMRIDDEIIALRKDVDGIKNGTIPVGNMVEIDERLSILEQEVAEIKEKQIA